MGEHQPPGRALSSSPRSASSLRNRRCSSPLHCAPRTGLTLLRCADISTLIHTDCSEQHPAHRKGGLSISLKMKSGVNLRSVRVSLNSGSACGYGSTASSLGTSKKAQHILIEPLAPPQVSSGGRRMSGRKPVLVPPSGRAEEGWSPASHLASSVLLHYRVILTPSTMQLATLGIVRGWLGLAQSVWETLRLLSCSLPWCRGQKQQGTTPSPVPTAGLPGGRLAWREQGRRKSRSVLEVSTCLPIPRDPAALPPGTTSPVPETGPGPNQKQLPFHSSTAGTCDELWTQ